MHNLAIVVCALFLAAVPLDGKAQRISAETIAEAEDLLDSYIKDELNIQHVAFTINSQTVQMAVNVGRDDDQIIIGKIGLLASIAGAAAPWTRQVQLSVYSEKAPLVYIKIPTGKINSYLRNEIGAQDYMASWELEGVSSGQTGSETSGLLQPTADSHVYAYDYSGWNKANWGKYEVLAAGWHPSGGEKRAYLTFDLSNVDPARVGKATLRLFHYHHTGGGNALALGVYRVTSPWTEGAGTYKPSTEARLGEISWVHQPSVDSQRMAQFQPSPGMNKWVEVDITPLVRAWLSGTPNHGLMIKAEGSLTAATPEAQYGFYSREAEAEKRPVLSLSGVNETPHPGGAFSDLGGTQTAAGQWTVGGKSLDSQGSRFFWDAGNFTKAILNEDIPLENVAVEFDGYAEKNGFNVYLHNEHTEGYLAILGGWFNTKSGSDVGKNLENRELVSGEVWKAKTWHHYKVIRQGDVLSAFCGNRKIFERRTERRFQGTGKLIFDSYGSRMGLDNVTVRRLSDEQE